jgi:hypothetical protein
MVRPVIALADCCRGLLTVLHRAAHSRGRGGATMDELNSKLIFGRRMSVFEALNATLPHWNDEILGDWDRLRRIKNFGSYISRYVKTRSGVYRVVAVAEDTIIPVHLDRICGQDRTGTLYIGRASRLRSRLQQLVRSVIERCRSSEHPACRRLKYPPLSKRFHPNSLALTWCYESECQTAEYALLRAYRDSFGEKPPLNGNVD